MTCFKKKNFTTNFPQKQKTAQNIENAFFIILESACQFKMNDAQNLNKSF